MSLFKRKRSLTPEEYAKQQALLRHSAEKGVASLNSLCDKLHILLHDTEAIDPNNDPTEEPPAAAEDVYHQFLNSPDALSTTRHHDNLSTNKRSHARINKFLNEARNEMGVSVKNSNLVNKLKFRREHQRAHGSEDCFVDGRYLVWLCGMVFEQCNNDVSVGSVDGEGTEEKAIGLLDSWQQSIVNLFTEDAEEKIMWRLLIQKLGLTPKMMADATKRHLNTQRGQEEMGVYFTWPSFLRNMVLNRPDEDENLPRSNKRRKSNDGSAYSLEPQYKPISLLEMRDPEIQQERNGWLPLLGYVIAHAYLARDTSSDDTIHETMDYLQNVLVPTLPTTLGFDNDKRNSLLSGVAAYLIDSLGDALAVLSLSLGAEGEDGEYQQQRGMGSSGVGSIVGAEVAQIVGLLSVYSLMPTLAKCISCPLAGLVSETAGTLLDYSDVHHRLHHEDSPMADVDVIQQLMAKDALKVMYFIDKCNPQLRKELSAKKFTQLTFDDTEGDPCKHPIITYLQARLVSGNLDEGSTLCRTLEECSGIDKETERCCWYSLFDKMQEENVLLEHHWEVNRGIFSEVPVMDHSGKVSLRRIGNITLANINIGPFGRKVALEYLNDILSVAKEDLFSAKPSKATRSKRQFDHDKQYFAALKDGIRRTVLRFLLPRPHSPDEVLSIANRVSEAGKPPLMKHHDGAPKGQDAGVLCCRILQQPSLLKIWEDNEAASENERVARAQQAVLQPTLALAAEKEEDAASMEAAEVAQRAIMPEEVPTHDDGVLDMSMELIPPTPAKSPQKPAPAFKPASPQEEVIELGDSDDEEIVVEDAHDEDQKAEIELEESSDGGEGGQDDESMTKSLEGSSHVDELEGEEVEGADDYDSNEEYDEENEAAMNYPPHYHQYAGNYSESDDYEVEDQEEADRRLAFEGQYDAEEGRGTRGNSSSGGSVEVYDIGSSSEEEKEEKPEGVSKAYDDANESDEPTETAILNEVVNDYIGATTSEPPEVEAHPDVNDGQILHDNVNEYIPVASPSKKSPEKSDNSGEEAVAEDVAVAEIVAKETLESTAKVSVHHDSAAIVAGQSTEHRTLMDHDVNLQSEAKPGDADIENAEEEAYKSDAPYSSDGGNLGGELSEDMNADDEHESLDTEDDKRSLAEQGETFDDEEAGPSSSVHSDANEDTGNLMEIDQPSILVAAAMSSQHQGSSYPMVYRRSSLKSVDNAEATAAPNDETAANANIQSPSANEPIDLIDSDVEAQEGEGGQLTDDGYVPDAEATEEEKIEKKKTRTIDDGYVPDAEATEEESSKPIGPGNKAAKKRDVRFEAVIETREAPPMPPPPVEPAANQSIDDGYLPDGLLTEEEKRERQQRRSRSIEEGYLPDGHTTATDDDTAEKRERRFPHRKAAPAEADAIDPGYLPSAVEGTEEERSEEESQETFASVLVATALVTQKGKGASDIASKASLATARIAKPKSLSTQSIDDGYVPEGTFDEEERSKLRKETRSQYVESGYLPDGHTTPGDATEEDQPDDKPKSVLEDAKMKLSESVAAVETSTGAPVPPPEPAASLSIDDGYLPSAVEEERSEEEDTLTDVKNNAHPHDVINDTEEESLAMASSADITEKHSKPDNDTAAAHETKEPDNATSKGETEEEDQVQSTTKKESDYDDNPEQNADSSLNNLSVVPPETESTSPKKAAIETPVKSSPKPTRRSRRNTKDHQETPDRPASDAESVQSETSSVRRSSRIKTRTAPSPKVPSSITTGGRRGKKTPALPAVPEDEKLEEVVEKTEETAPSIATRTRRKGKDDSESHASGANDERASVATRTRRKRGAAGADDDVSHASSVNEETSKAPETKRAKTGTSKKSGAKKQKDAESQENVSESVSSQPTKTRRGRAKKNDTTTKDDASKSVASSPGKVHRGRAKKNVTQDNISELSASPPAKTRGRAKKNVAETKDEAEPVAIPPKTRRGRAKKKDADQETEASSAPSSPATRSSRRTRKTTPSEASESVASTRPRRSTRASSKK